MMPISSVDLTTIIIFNSVRSNWRYSVTGIWENAKTALYGESNLLTGFLILYEENSYLSGISTTQNSIWAGRYSNGILAAHYTNEFNGSGTVQLQLSPDGRTLSGEFWTADGRSRGIYVAHRAVSVSKAVIATQIIERFGSSIRLL